MANVKITEKDGQRVIEVSDISFNEVRELVRPNGNAHAQSSGRSPQFSELKFPRESKPEYSKFKQGLSAHAKKFFAVLHQNPSGISGDSLAEKLGFNSTNQIGGVTGGGIGKLANRLNIKLTDVYTKEVTRKDGERVVIYRPGLEIEKVL